MPCPVQMPELPEVETIIKQLREILTGKEITAVEIVDKSVVDEKIAQLAPFTIKNVHRRGKSIIFELDNSLYLLTHLRMTGHFHYVKGLDQKYLNFMMAKFYLDDGSFLTHNSIRKFGSIKLLNENELNLELSGIGPEPLDISMDEFLSLLSRYPKSTIKTKLMDQSFVAGIGNIYAQEILYHAGIHPKKKIKDVPKERLIKLHQQMQRVLALAIEMKGSTVDNYTSLSGRGGFQGMLAVYRKSYCPKDHPIVAVNLGGRGTSFCPICQS